jgi:hypothetical protein
MAGKGNPNIAEYGKNTRFCGSSAVEAAKKKHEREAVTKDLLNAVAEGLDINAAAAKLAELIENGDMKAWQLWLEYNASKPATKVEMDNKMVFTFGEDDDDPEAEA